MVGRIIAGAFAALFAYAAFLQLNDPDPWLWVIVYLVAALSLATAAAGQRQPRWVPATIAVLCGAWSIWLATIVFGGGDVKQMFPGEEKTGYVVVDTEEGREMGGLAIVAVVMLGVTIGELRMRNGAAPPSVPPQAGGSSQ